jgi:hypothetical protein
METEISKSTQFQVTEGKSCQITRLRKLGIPPATDLQAAWEGHKMIGPVVADDIVMLVKHRNTSPEDRVCYHEMSLALRPEPGSYSIFDELDNLTRIILPERVRLIPATKLYKIKT